MNIYKKKSRFCRDLLIFSVQFILSPGLSKEKRNRNKNKWPLTVSLFALSYFAFIIYFKQKIPKIVRDYSKKMNNPYVLLK
jgi:hypothetical protein